MRFKSIIATILSLVMSGESVWAIPYGSPVTSPTFVVSIPSSLGYITDAYTAHPASGAVPDMVLIQNLHVNRSVQFAISGILKRLKAQGLMPDHIALEGATGPIDISSMQRYPDPVIRKEAADYLVQQGEMPGAMHFAVTEGAGGLFGIETDEYYQANLEMFRRSYEGRTSLHQELDKIQDALPRLKKEPATHENAVILEKDLSAINQLINTQTTPENLYSTLNQASQAVEHLKLVFPKDISANLLEPLSASVNFYALALLRDKELFKNTLSVRELGQQKTTIVITGGFHTKGLTEQCKRQGLSYVVITPNVRHHDKVDEDLYVRRLMGNHLTAEQVEQGLDWAAMGMLEESFWPAVSQLWSSATQAARLRHQVGIPTRRQIVTVVAAVFAPLLQWMQAEQVRQLPPVPPLHTQQEWAKFIHEQRPQTSSGKLGLPVTFREAAGDHMPNPDAEMIIREAALAYDTALAVIELDDAGKHAEAEEILLELLTGSISEMPVRAYPTGNNHGAFAPHHRGASYLFNMTTADGRNLWPQWKFWSSNTGPSAWVAIAVVHHFESSGMKNPDLLHELRSLGDAMLLLQDSKTQGGVRYGAHHMPGQPDFNQDYDRINSENEVSAHAALRQLATATGDAKYTAGADNILHWLSQADVFNPETGQMQKGMMNPKTGLLYVDAVWRNGRWEIDPRHATDSGGTWTISSLSAKFIDGTWGKQASFRMWQSIRSGMGWTADYRRTGPAAEIAGVDFTNKDEQGRPISSDDALISPEWTAGAVRAVEHLIDYYENGAGKGQLTPVQISGLKNDVRSMRAWLDAHPNNYAYGPGMTSHRQGQTWWGWFSGHGTAMAAVYIRFNQDPLNPGKSFTYIITPPIAPAHEQKSDVASEQEPLQETPAESAQPRQPAESNDGTIIAERAEQFYNDGTSHSSGTNDPGDLSIYKSLIFKFDPSMAGTNFLVRIVPQDASYEGQTGLNTTIYTVGPDGTAEVSLDPSLYGISAADLKNPKQLAVSSGARPWGQHNLHQSGSKHADYQEVRGSNKSGNKERSPEPKKQARQPKVEHAQPAPPASIDEGTRIAGRATRFYDDGTTHSSGTNEPGDLSGYKSLIFKFDPSAAGTNFLVRIVPLDASYEGQDGLNTTVYTVGPDGMAVVPLSPALYGLSAADFKNPKQLALSSGARPWGQYNLHQPGSKHADYQEVRGSNRAAPHTGGALLLPFSPSGARLYRVNSPSHPADVRSTVRVVRNDSGTWLNVHGRLWSGVPGIAYQPVPDNHHIGDFEHGHMANLYKALLPPGGKGIDPKKYPELVKLAQSRDGAPAQDHAKALADMGMKFIRTYNLAATNAEDLKLVSQIFQWMYEQQGIMFIAGMYAPTQAQAEFTATVLAGNPALLMYDGWNEINLRGANPNTYKQIDELAGIVKRTDPNHPIALVVAQALSSRDKQAIQSMTNIDIVSVTIYERPGEDAARYVKSLQELFAPKAVMIGEIGVPTDIDPKERAARLRGIAQALTMTEPGPHATASLAYTLFEFVGEKWKAAEGNDNRWWILGTPSQEAVGGVARRWVPGPVASANHSEVLNPNTLPYTLLSSSEIRQLEHKITILQSQLRGPNRRQILKELKRAQTQLDRAQRALQAAHNAIVTSAQNSPAGVVPVSPNSVGVQPTEVASVKAPSLAPASSQSRVAVMAKKALALAGTGTGVLTLSGFSFVSKPGTSAILETLAAVLVMMLLSVFAAWLMAPKAKSGSESTKTKEAIPEKLNGQDGFTKRELVIGLGAVGVGVVLASYLPSFLRRKSSPSGSKTVNLNEATPIAGRAAIFYDDGIAHSSGTNDPGDLSGYKSLIFRFPAGQGGTNFLVRVVPQGASYEGQDGLNTTIYTVGEDGIAVVPLDPELYGLNSSDLKNPIQLAISSGNKPWGKYSLGQSGTKHADYLEVRGSTQEAPKNTGVIRPSTRRNFLGLSKVGSVALAAMLVFFVGALFSQPSAAQEIPGIIHQAAQVVPAQVANIAGFGAYAGVAMHTVSSVFDYFTSLVNLHQIHQATYHYLLGRLSIVDFHKLGDLSKSINAILAIPVGFAMAYVVKQQMDEERGRLFSKAATAFSA